MESQAMGNIQISGAGTAGGGTYRDVEISGAGHVTGDIEAEGVRISGAGNFDGNVKASSISVSGACETKGSLDASEVKYSGSGKVGGDLKASVLHVSGALHVNGRVRAGEAHLSGSFKAEADVEAEAFHSSGGIRIGGLLSADQIDICVGGKCRIGEIGGENIRIHTSTASRILRFFEWSSGSMETDSVEGDEIYLENTRAKAVRGRRVVIGPGCRIELVEYSESLHIDPDAKVDNHTYTGGGTPPTIDQGPTDRSSGSGGRNTGGSLKMVRLSGASLHPVLALLVAFGALMIAGLVLLLVLPSVGLIVGAVLGVVGLLMLVLVIGAPILIAGSVILGLIFAPLRFLGRAIRGH